MTGPKSTGRPSKEAEHGYSLPQTEGYSAAAAVKEALSLDKDYETLVIEGLEARKGLESYQWKIGDLALLVATVYGECTLQKYAEDIGVEYSTLRHYRAVCQAYEFGRRRPNLSFSHHQAVAARPDRLALLQEAENKRWSVKRMLGEIAPKPPMANVPKAGKQFIEVRVSSPPPSQTQPRRMVYIPVFRAPSGNSPTSEKVNVFVDNRPKEVVERDAAQVRRQQDIIRALGILAEDTDLPEREVDTFGPAHCEVIESYLPAALEWLTNFNTEWCKRRGRKKDARF